MNGMSINRTRVDKARCGAFLTALLLVAGVGCSDSDEVGKTGQAAGVGGVWQASLMRTGADAANYGPLRFLLEVQRSAEDGSLSAWALNGEERVPFSRVVENGEQIVFYSDGYDSEITAQLTEGGSALLGEWRKTGADGDSRLSFGAQQGVLGRFTKQPRAELEQETTATQFGGVWTVAFLDEDGEFEARGIFEQNGRHLSGTFRTSTGDYRFLDGAVVEVQGPDGERRDELRLSAFDGAHAFLFHAHFDGDGRLVGDFWSRDTYHATWSARPAIAGDELPNPFKQVGLTNDQGRFSFSFPDVHGQVLSSTDDRFDGKVVLIDIFGSWCPNCNDSAPYLASLYQRYHDQGLEMVGLAYEMTGDFDRDADLVGRYADRHKIPFPLLVAGTSDKEEAGKTLPDLDAVLSYPTKVFLDRTGKVREIYSGYDGPSTGSAHQDMKVSMERVLEELLAESPSL